MAADAVLSVIGLDDRKASTDSAGTKRQEELAAVFILTTSGEFSSGGMHKLEKIVRFSMM